ncbi:hypothetical protein QZH41_003100 [Actinostola sp. cb2023]|nr:hypothetical protein QZH41_003100 [Actinostola sp. cb2023]
MLRRTTYYNVAGKPLKAGLFKYNHDQGGRRDMTDRSTSTSDHEWISLPQDGRQEGRSNTDQNRQAQVGGLGFLVKERQTKPCVTISSIVKGSTAEANGTLCQGDVLLEVNGKSLKEIEFEKALKILNDIAIGSTVTLKLQAKFGKNARDNQAFVGTPCKNGKTLPSKSDGKEKSPDIKDPVNGQAVDTSSNGFKATNGHSEKVMAEETDVREKKETAPRVACVHKCPPTVMKLKNWETGKETIDTLHQKAYVPTHCSPSRCKGSIMRPTAADLPNARPYGIPRSKEEVAHHAEDFIEQYYTSMKLADSPAHKKRLTDVLQEIEETGTYDLTEKELMYGARMAWRNAPRCIGRIQWNRLQICISLGWKPKGGSFDVLPVVLQAGGEEPELFEIPPELILEVTVKHPRYMVTEIAARDLGDPARYNMLEPIAKKMGLDTRSHISLWKDTACVELNLAVLQSFQDAGVTITDHHSAAESFMKHFENEDDPWKHYRIRQKKESASPRKKLLFKEVAKAVKFSANLMGKAMAKRTKAIILYATETGKSENYAKMLSEMFLHAFDPKSFARYLYELRHPTNEKVESQEMATISSLLMQKEKEKGLKMKDDEQPLGSLRYSVFGLGSRAYPNFCAFAKSADKIIQELGGEQIFKMGEGDELCSQEESFKTWARNVFKAACETFCIGEDVNTAEADASLNTISGGWSPEKYRFTRDSGKLMDAGSSPFGTTKKWEKVHRFPVPITLREAFSRHIDITGTPSPQILNYLSTQGDNSYENWRYDKQSNIVEVLDEFPSLKVNAALLLTQLPLLQPRFYSISSSQALHPGEVHVTVAVVKFTKRGGQGPVHHGVCSTWLESLVPDDIVPCFVRHAPSFHLPDNDTAPIIMVGPGTGIAPFRSFWQQRQHDIANKSPPLGDWGNMVLYFGCRSSIQDDIYQDETAQAVKANALTRVRTALSREPDQPKVSINE